MSFNRIQIVLSNEVPDPQEKNAPRPMQSGVCPAEEARVAGLPTCPPATVIV